MGQIASRLNGVVRRPAAAAAGQDEDLEQQLTFSGAAGSYFGSHFLMCGGRFDLSKPEAFLFGENSDLDLLGHRAVPFPYSSPLGSDEVHPLNLLINIRKESVKFVKVKAEDGSIPNPNLYRLEFTLDADCACYVQVHFNARELYQEGEVHFAYKNKKVIHSEQYHFDLGCDQTFNNYVFDASQWDISELNYTGGLYFPVVIVLQTDGVDRSQMQSTMCTIDVANDSAHALILKPLRQKIACDGVIYLLQEMFGIENKESSGDMGDDNGLECIICMSDVRDTVILPCRHLCICNNCADTLRYKLNNCPICRSPFRALIQLKARRQNRSQGYETVTLVEGLNGVQNHSYSSTEDAELNTTADRRRGHSRQHSRARNPLHEVLSMDEALRETTDGIEMTDYTSAKQSFEETPVLSTISSRSSGSVPLTYVSSDDIDIEIGSLQRIASKRSTSSSANSKSEDEAGSSGLLSDEKHEEEEDDEEGEAHINVAMSKDDEN